MLEFGEEPGVEVELGSGFLLSTFFFLTKRRYLCIPCAFTHLSKERTVERLDNSLLHTPEDRGKC